MSLQEIAEKKMKYSYFTAAVIRFNGMYRMQVAASPTLRVGDNGPTSRLLDFKHILLKEIAELDDIIARCEKLESGSQADDVPMTVLTDLADFLVDVQVYCASEMIKFGLPIDVCQAIVMDSNFSKMFPDGPHFDSHGHLLKGPDYWKPEPRLLAYLQSVEVGGKTQP